MALFYSGIKGSRESMKNQTMLGVRTMPMLLRYRDFESNNADDDHWEIMIKENKETTRG